MIWKRLKVQKMVVQGSDLSKEERGMVTSVLFTPAMSVTEWLLRKDHTFRTTIAQILNSTEFPVSKYLVCFVGILPSLPLSLPPPPSPARKENSNMLFWQ